MSITFVDVLVYGLATWALSLLVFKSFIIMAFDKLITPTHPHKDRLMEISKLLSRYKQTEEKLAPGTLEKLYTEKKKLGSLQPPRYLVIWKKLLNCPFCQFCEMGIVVFILRAYSPIINYWLATVAVASLFMTFGKQSSSINTSMQQMPININRGNLIGNKLSGCGENHEKN